MSQQLRRPDRVAIFFVLLFVVITVAGSATNAAHYTLAVNLRSILMAVIALGVGFLVLESLLLGKVSRRFVIFTLIFSTLILYGLIGSAAYGGIRFFLDNQLLFAFLVVSAAFSVATFLLISKYYNDPLSSKDGIALLSVYFLCSPLLILLLGGIEFGMPPRIDFTLDGSARVYSQGFTLFYAIAAVYFFVLAAKAGQEFRTSLPLFTAAGCFFGLSVLGGARGDFVAGVVALILFFLRNANQRTVVVVTAISLISYYFFVDLKLWEEILFFRRMEAIIDGSAFGMRDVLFGQALQLLENEPRCLLFGCGFNYFQIYWSYEYGMYPHNILLEYAISYGVLIGTLVIGFALVGMADAYRSWGRESPVFYMFIVLLLALLKSGNLLSMTALPLLSVFAYFGARRLLLRNRKAGVRVRTRFG